MFAQELYTGTLHTHAAIRGTAVRLLQGLINPADLYEARPWKRPVKRGSFLTPPAAQGARRGAAVRLIQGWADCRALLSGVGGWLGIDPDWGKINFGFKFEMELGSWMLQLLTKLLYLFFLGPGRQISGSCRLPPPPAPNLPSTPTHPTHILGIHHPPCQQK